MKDTTQDASASDTETVFARRVRELRETAGITQRQVAAQMSAAGYRMHQTTMAKIESGERPVLIGEAVHLAAALGVSLTDMVIGTDNERATFERVRAQAKVASLQTQLNQRFKQLEATKTMIAHIDAELEAAKKQLAELEAGAK